jgi:hypothetical protein
MDRKNADNREMIKKMEQLQVFLKGDYVRLGHPSMDDDGKLRAFVDAMEHVSGVLTGGGSEDGLPAAFRVIHAAIRGGGWFLAILREHLRDASCWKAFELCKSIWKYFQFKWRPIWINRDDVRYADLIAVMWKDLELRTKYAEVVWALKKINQNLSDKKLALESILKLYGELPDTHLFMYDRLDGTVIDPEYTNERQTLENTCTQLKHLLVQVYELLRTRRVESISYWWHEFCRLMKEYFGTVLQEPENAEVGGVERDPAQSVGDLLLQLKQLK